jgi:hypothetical protein
MYSTTECLAYETEVLGNMSCGVHRQLTLFELGESNEYSLLNTWLGTNTSIMFGLSFSTNLILHRLLLESEQVNQDTMNAFNLVFSGEFS